MEPLKHNLPDLDVNPDHVACWFLIQSTQPKTPAAPPEHTQKALPPFLEPEQEQLDDGFQTLTMKWTLIATRNSFPMFEQLTQGSYEWQLSSTHKSPFV